MNEELHTFIHHCSSSANNKIFMMGNIEVIIFLEFFSLKGAQKSDDVYG